MAKLLPTTTWWMVQTKLTLPLQTVNRTRLLSYPPTLPATLPVNIVKKVVTDPLKFGAVQRAYLGIQYPQEDMPEEAKVKYGIKDGDGVFVTGVAPDGAAKEAGIEKGYFITKVNGVTVASGPE